MSAQPQYRVPRLLWESLEASLGFAGKNYVKRLANILEVPEKELIKEVFKTNAMHVCIHDWTDSSFMCNAFVVQGAIKQPCGKAKMCGSEFCEFHSTKNATVPDDIQNVSKIFCESFDETETNSKGDYWKLENNCVINSKADLIGYVKDDILYLVGPD